MAKIETETKKINYKSDFDFKLKIKSLGAEGSYVDVGFPTYDFKGYLYTRGMRKYEFGKQDEKLLNCFNDNGTIHIVANNHSLFSGVVKIDFYIDIPNDIYPDNHKLIVTNCATTIELVEGCGDEFTAEEIEIVAPYIKGDKGEKGDPLTWETMTQEQREKVVQSAVDEIQKEQITILENTSDATDYNDVF